MGFRPAVLVSSGQDMLSRAPDATVDGLFQALHATAKRPEESQGVVRACSTPRPTVASTD
jgi:hypothetical protein